ncbi:MAG: hypothetical protein Q7J57_04370 [Gemmobacter sp.]|nr:hypothetical protein [Gemmobacter sp.]
MSNELNVMPREMRMMSERVFSLTSLPKGFALSLSDLPMYSQMQGLGGLALLERRHRALLAADAGALRIAAENGATVSLDAAGQHSWVALPSALDLLAELCARLGHAEVTVQGAVDDQELALATGLGLRLGLAVTLVSSGVLAATPCPCSDPVLDRALRDGALIDADLWWRIYALAQTALAPDTPVSRRHAGVIIVTEDGTVIGRKDNDDDSDMSLLVRARVDAEGTTT